MMKSKDDIAEIIFDAFRKQKSRAGHIIMMRVFRLSIIPKLDPKEQDLFQAVVNELIGKGFIEYEQTSPECLRLTEKGYDYIYTYRPKATEEKENEPSKTDTLTMNNPFKILGAAIEKVPFVKYALGVAGIAAAIAIIKSFGIENYSAIPIISILVMLGFMVLLFLFSTLTRSKDYPLKLAGYTLVFTTVIITCVSSVLLTTSVFFDKPKPITDYSIFPKDKTDTNTIKPSQDTTSLKPQKQDKPTTEVIKPVTGVAQASNKTAGQNTTTQQSSTIQKLFFPYANLTDLSTKLSDHKASYFVQYDKRPVEKIFWKAKITGEFNDEFDCVYAASYDTGLKLLLLNGNDIACAKNLKNGMNILVWGMTKESSESSVYLLVDVDAIKIIQ